MQLFIARFYRRITGILKDHKLLSQLQSSDRRLIQRIKRKNLTYLSSKKMIQIVHTCRTIEKNKISGKYLEAGSVLGGSTILIATLKEKDRPFVVYDVFGMIPAPSKQDTPDAQLRYKTILQGNSKGIGRKKYYGYQENLYGKVQHSLTSFGINTDRMTVKLIKGLLQDTMLVEDPIVFAHVDVDWYESVKACLDRIFPQLVINGSIIIDGYYEWGGCRKATDEFIIEKQGQVVLDSTMDSMKITRIK